MPSDQSEACFDCMGRWFYRNVDDRSPPKQRSLSLLGYLLYCIDNDMLYDK